MKKIYILTAVLALLTLSLNAQDATKVIDPSIKTMKAPKFTATASHQTHQGSATSIKAGSFSFNEVLRGIKGMSSVLRPAQGAASAAAIGQSRAPLKINSDEFTVGPFEGNNFSTNGIGFPTAYGDNYQQIYVTTELDREEFIDHNGEEIVGFRFALAGNSTQTAVLYDFIAWPFSDNYFSQNRYTWSIPEYTGATPINSFDDIVITTNAGTSTNFRSITVYDQNNNVLTSWDYTGSTSTVTSGGTTYTYYVLPDGWSLSNVYLFQYGSGTSAVGYLSTGSTGSITISGDLLAGSSSVRVVVNVYSDNGTETLDVNGNTQTIPTTTSNSFTYNFSPSGTSAPVYVELAAGQWYECYLDEPIVFNVADSITGMRMGYRYFQYPSTETSELLYPIAVNPQSTSHDHVTYMTTQNGTTTQVLTSWNYATDVQNFPSSWTVPGVGGSGTLSGSLWFSGSSGGTFTIPASALQGCSTVTVKVTAGKENSNTHSISVNNSSQNLTQALVEYTWNNVNATNGITITYSDYYVNISKIEIIGDVPNYQTGWWIEDFSQYGDLAVQLIFKNSIPKTEAPVITADTTATSVIITATATDPTAAVSMTIGDQTYTGTGTATATLPRGTTDQQVTVSATAQETDHQVSNPATATIGIPALPVTPAPVITYEVTATSVIITATGNGTVTLSAGGQTATGNGTASVTIPRTTEDQVVTATATAQEADHQVSATTTQQITIPEAGRSPMPTINMTDNGDGTYTITVTGTGQVALYINDAEHGGTAGDPVATGQGSVSITVEEHSLAMTLPVQATNQEGDLAISRTAEATYNIPAMTIDNTFTVLDPQPANASTPIKMESMMFVDRFSKVIPIQNNHPRWYYYTLEETQVRQRTSNAIPVEVKHTGSDGLGFYTLTQIDNDLERKLKMDVRNAAIDLPLEKDPGVFFYTAERSTAAYPDQADRKYFGVLQRTSDGNYTETLNPSYDYDSVYPGGQHHIHLDVDTITGQYNQYLTYVPVVWTMGFDRVLYETDHEHNSYGAPKWKTGVADVLLNAVSIERQESASTTWMDGSDKVSMYMMTVDATGVMPTVNTMPYEPYMFRVFVESKNGKLRNWTYVPENVEAHVGSHFEGVAGAVTGPLTVWSEYMSDSLNTSYNEAAHEVYFVKDKAEQYDSETGAWNVPGNMNILFAALDDLTTEGQGENERVIEDDLKIYVRFYYIVKGSAANHIHGLTLRDGGEAPAGYGSEGQGTPPAPRTGVSELSYYGDVVSTTYYNVQGMKSDVPFDGINIVVTRYSNGTTRTTKVVR